MKIVVWRNQYNDLYKENVISKAKDILQNIFEIHNNQLSEIDLQINVEFIKKRL